MNSKQFYRLFAAETGANLEDSKATCAAVFDLLSRCIKENDRVLIQGLGTFKKKMRKASKAGNLKGEGTVIVPAKETVIFKEWGISMKSSRDKA